MLQVIVRSLAKSVQPKRLPLRPQVQRVVASSGGTSIRSFSTLPTTTATAKTTPVPVSSSWYKVPGKNPSIAFLGAARDFATSANNIDLPSNLVIEDLEGLLEEQQEPFDDQELLRSDNSEKIMPVLQLKMSEYEDDDDDDNDADDVEGATEDGERLDAQTTVTLDNRVFGVPIRQDIVHNVVVWQRARWRTGTAHSKTRADVRGGGRKPWRQKGTGRARHGSIRSPIWRGGGRAHGKKRRDFSFKLNRKVRQMGLRVALAAKWREGNLLIVDADQFQTHKTVHLLDALEDLDIVPDDGTLMIIDADEQDNKNENLALAASNVPWLSTFPQRGAHVYAIVKHHRVAITTSALQKLTGRLLP